MWFGPDLIKAQVPEWNLLEEKSGVKIYTFESDCEAVAVDFVNDPTALGDENAQRDAPKKTIFLRFENTNNYMVNISWNNILRADQNTPDESIRVPGRGSADTECQDSPVIQLTVQQDDGYPVSATDAISFLNIIISSN